ncbi:glycosyltransferase [Lachnospiraceae bacterium MD308]|mgnify:CR=1 FL=1|nr:glycosyltransferase [Lachnospiraceae bacterium MD308]MCI8579911.1 glycosyltransferase [Dorea sp.]
MEERKKILFVINTLGRAGAEKALLELLRQIDSDEYEMFLYVLMGQGEMIRGLPSCVRVLNKSISDLSVFTNEGRRKMARTVLHAFWSHGRWCRKLGFIFLNLTDMARKKRFQFSKLFWRTISDGAERFETEFDLAVAWLEGGSAYYVADYVKAKRKAAFVHIDYENAGYTKEMDRACWGQYHRIFAISGEVKEHFQAFYPEYAKKVSVFHNYMNQEAIRLLAKEPGGFSDNFDGIRLLTVGRLTYQKGYDIAIEAMRILKTSGKKVRWYVLGEGELRRQLEKKIACLGLQDDFVLLGAVLNPYPFYVQADIYVHATRFEGKSIAVQEAQTLGCAIVVSDCNGNRELLTDGEDGIICALTPVAVADSIAVLLEDEGKRKWLGHMAEKRRIPQEQNLLLKELLEERDDEQTERITGDHTGL